LDEVIGNFGKDCFLDSDLIDTGGWLAFMLSVDTAWTLRIDTDAFYSKQVAGCGIQKQEHSQLFDKISTRILND